MVGPALLYGNGSGERDIAEGPLSEEIWQTFKAAIEKEDNECFYKCKQEGKP